MWNIEIMIILIVLFLVVGSILGFVAFVRQVKGSNAKSAVRSIRRLELRVRRLEEIISQSADYEELVPKKEDVTVETPASEPEKPPTPEKQHEPEAHVGQKQPAQPCYTETTSGATGRMQKRPAETPRSRHSGESLLQDIEKVIGEKWIAWAGAVVIFLALAFFIKHAIDMGLLGPTARCALGVIAGMLMIWTGDHCLRREMRGLGQGLIGGGLAVLYLSIFAAFSFYNLLPPQIAFVFMVAVTVGGMLLALLHNAPAIAFIAILGGFLTPVLCRTEEDRRDLLFGYITVLNLGVLAMALFCR